MINLNLMVGDWVQSDGKLILVFHLDSEMGEVNRVNYGGIKDIQPVPLTPELMEKIEGWKCEGNYDYWLHYKNEQGFIISMWLKDYQVGGFEKKGHWYYGETFHDFRYLHQLQQLIRLFTNKEIEVKWGK
jgi:hypothetical protein